MADEQLDGTEAVETEEQRPEGVDETEQQQPEANPAVEALASELGWSPRDKFKGDPEKWKPADEYIRASRPIADNLKSEIRSMRDQLDRVTRTSADLLETTVNQRIAERDAYWQRVHRQAVEEGNVEQAEKALDERTKLKTEAERAKPAAEGLPAETATFMERNRDWFGTATADGRFTGGDPLARTRAMQICETLAKQGIPPDEQLRQAERAVRKEFPELFPTPAKPPASTQTSSSRAATTSSRKKGYADMPAESQKMARDYLERHKIPLEQFAESYWNQQDGRRVA